MKYSTGRSPFGLRPVFLLLGMRPLTRGNPPIRPIPTAIAPGGWEYGAETIRSGGAGTKRRRKTSMRKKRFPRRGGGVLLALLLCLTLPPTAALAAEQPIGYGL